MRTFARKKNQPQKPVSSKLIQSKRATRGTDHREHPVLHLQRTIGNHAVQRLLQTPAQELEDESRTSALTRKQGLQTNTLGVQPGRFVSSPPVAKVTAMEDQGKTGSGVFEGKPTTVQPEGHDQTPSPLNEDGLIDGEWTSETEVHVFVNGGRTGRAIAHFAGGTGGTGGNAGVISTVAPVIDTSAPAAVGGTARAWVRSGTGTATVRRSYIGVLTGANGASHYITARAAARIDRHEVGHITQARTHHNTHITPLETRIAQRTGERKALNQGADAAAARTALETFLDWNTSITNFRNADIADNGAGGTFDTTDAATADFYADYGARTVRGVNYAHYIDTPPGP